MLPAAKHVSTENMAPNSAEDEPPIDRDALVTSTAAADL
jgi:hypothetical protein